MPIAHNREAQKEAKPKRRKSSRALLVAALAGASLLGRAGGMMAVEHFTGDEKSPAETPFTTDEYERMLLDRVPMPITPYQEVRKTQTELLEMKYRAELDTYKEFAQHPTTLVIRDEVTNEITEKVNGKGLLIPYYMLDDFGYDDEAKLIKARYDEEETRVRDAIDSGETLDSNYFKMSPFVYVEDSGKRRIVDVPNLNDPLYIDSYQANLIDGTKLGIPYELCSRDGSFCGTFKPRVETMDHELVSDAQYAGADLVQQLREFYAEKTGN